MNHNISLSTFFGCVFDSVLENTTPVLATPKTYIDSECHES